MTSSKEYKLAHSTAVYQATVLENPFIPHEPYPKQQQFLSLDNFDVMYGGAAGGGKSDALLMAALQYVGEPGYSALIIRKTYQELSKSGALMQRATNWLKGKKCHWNGSDKVWKFPNGSSLEFGHLQHPGDEFAYQSAEYQFIGIDQIEEFSSPDQPVYLMSRLRRLAESKIPLRFRCGSNPGGPGFAWIKDRYIPEDDDYKSLNDKPVWKKTNVDDYGKEHVSAFVFARLQDNPALDVDSYIQTLNWLLPIDRERLLRGNWKVVEGGKVINRDWFTKFLDTVPGDVYAAGRGWDLAATAGSEKNPRSKRTAGVRMTLHKSGLIVIHNCVAFKKSPGARDLHIEQTANSDGPGVVQVIEQEGGSGGISQNDTLKKRLKKSRVISQRVTGDKYVRAGPFATQVEEGNVALLNGDWIEPFLEEMNALKPEPPPFKGYKDRLDASSLIYGYLLRNRSVRFRRKVKVQSSYRDEIPGANWRDEYPE